MYSTLWEHTLSHTSLGKLSSSTHAHLDSTLLTALHGPNEQSLLCAKYVRINVLVLGARTTHVASADASTGSTSNPSLVLDRLSVFVPGTHPRASPATDNRTST